MAAPRPIRGSIAIRIGRGRAQSIPFEVPISMRTVGRLVTLESPPIGQHLAKTLRELADTFDSKPPTVGPSGGAGDSGASRS